MAIVGRKRMARKEALKILEIAEWASRDEIEAAYACIKQRFQGKRAGLSRINCLLTEAKRILVNDADPASASRPGRIALQLDSWSKLREWLAGVGALSHAVRTIQQSQDLAESTRRTERASGSPFAMRHVLTSRLKRRIRLIASCPVGPHPD